MKGRRWNHGEPFGLSTLTSDERDLVDRDMGWLARMMWLHSREACALQPRTSMVAFLLEKPQSVAQHMVSSQSAAGSAPSYRAVANLRRRGWFFEVHFRQGPLEHAGDKPTAVGTNLPDFRDLQGSQGEVSLVWCSADSRVSPVWAPGFVQAIVFARQRWPWRLTQADSEQHVANSHVPYRRDCAVCVLRGAGNGRRHRSVVHADVCCMSADIAGPSPESPNRRPATFKYFLAVSYCFPRFKGVKAESDPTKTDGFDDATRLPGQTDACR